MTVEYCPTCWSEVERGAPDCPRCGFRLADFRAWPYARKLVAALRHPLREHRMTAIELVGRLRIEEAVPELDRIARADGDVYVVREAARALARIGGGAGREALLRLRRHPAKMVARYAAKQLEERGERG